MSLYKLSRTTSKESGSLLRYSRMPAARLEPSYVMARCDHSLSGSSFLPRTLTASPGQKWMRLKLGIWFSSSNSYPRLPESVQDLDRWKTTARSCFSVGFTHRLKLKGLVRLKTPTPLQIIELSPLNFMAFPNFPSSSTGL